MVDAPPGSSHLFHVNNSYSNLWGVRSKSLEIPITINIATVTGACCNCLTILSPETIVGLGEGESCVLLVITWSIEIGNLTIWVDMGNDVEVISVDELSELVVGLKVGEDIMGDILNGLPS